MKEIMDGQAFASKALSAAISSGNEAMIVARLVVSSSSWILGDTPSELQAASLANHARVGADNFANARAVDVGHVREVEEHLAAPLADDSPDLDAAPAALPRRKASSGRADRRSPRHHSAARRSRSSASAALETLVVSGPFVSGRSRSRRRTRRRRRPACRAARQTSRDRGEAGTRRVLRRPRTSACRHA